MPKKVKRRFNYDVDRKRKWRKMKKTPTIHNDTIRANWDETKSVKANMAQMGLALNPNVTPSSSSSQDKKQPVVKKMQVIEELEKIASIEVPVKLSMSQPDVQFCEYMMKKYGENYVAMARDIKNYYQETPKQIQRKIGRYQEIFKNDK